MTTPASPIVTLPTYPGPVEPSTVSFVSYGGDLTPPLGGQIQRILRLGTRFSLALSFPPMPYAVAMQWMSRIAAAEAIPAEIGVPQRGLLPTSPGALVINGAAAAPINTGGQIAVKGGTPHFQLYSGQIFHILAQADGRKYLAILIGDAQLDGAGAATLGIAPLLRFVPTDGDTLEFAFPKIQGFLGGMKQDWNLTLVRRIGLKLSITEDR